MEDEIELRPYIELLIKRWYLIVAAAILVGAAVFVISSLIPPTYEATALVAITEPRLRVQFEPRIEEVTEETQPLRAFPELAISDELLQELLQTIELSQVEVTSLEELRKIIEAQSGSDPALVRLSAKVGDPQDAALVANTWGRLFVARANEIFGDQVEDKRQFFIDRLAEAETELSAAEEALISFESSNRSSIIANELASLQDNQASYLSSKQEIAFLLQDLEGLHAQLNADSGGSVTFADQLTVLALQLQAFNADAAVPLQLQLQSTESLTAGDQDQQVAYLETLMATLETRLEHIDETLAGLEPQILTLQEQRQETVTENARLIRDRDVADETYMALARKVEEERITSDEATSVARMASEAAIPEQAESRGRLMYTALASFIAILLVIVAILAVDWWRAGDTNQP